MRTRNYFYSVLIACALSGLSHAAVANPHDVKMQAIQREITARGYIPNLTGPKKAQVDPAHMAPQGPQCTKPQVRHGS